MLSPSVDFQGIPSNRSFEEHSVSSAPPDNWGMVVGTWGTHANVETTLVHSGARSVRLHGALTTAIVSRRFLVGPGDIIATEVRYACIDFPTLDSCISVKLEYFYNNGTVPITTHLVSGGMATTMMMDPFNGRSSGRVTTPELTRYARLRIEKATADDYNLYVDTARVLITQAD